MPSPLLTVDNYLQQVINGYFSTKHFCGQFETATTNAIYSGQRLGVQFGGLISIDALPPGVSSYRLCSATLRTSSPTPALLCRIAYLGAYNFVTGLFDTGGPMPSDKEGGITRQLYSCVTAFVGTTITLSSGSINNISIDYLNQDGISKTSPAVSLINNAIAGSAAFMRLASGDYGAVDITNVNITPLASSTYSSGLLVFFGLNPIGVFNPIFKTVGEVMELNFLTDKPGPIKILANEQLLVGAFSNTAKRYQGTINFVGETI